MGLMEGYCVACHTTSHLSLPTTPPSLPVEPLRVLLPPTPALWWFFMAMYISLRQYNTKNSYKYNMMIWIDIMMLEKRYQKIQEIDTRIQHLWPIFWPCFLRAMSAYDWLVNWTNPSPDALPIPSSIRNTPFGVTGKPATCPQGQHHPIIINVIIEKPLLEGLLHSWSHHFAHSYFLPTL